MTMRPELLRGFYADATMPMARRRRGAAESLVLLIFHTLLFGGALGSVLLLLWLSAPGGR